MIINACQCLVAWLRLICMQQFGASVKLYGSFIHLSQGLLSASSIMKMTLCFIQLNWTMSSTCSTIKIKGPRINMYLILFTKH